jgi:hypothetical protein
MGPLQSNFDVLFRNGEALGDAFRAQMRDMGIHEVLCTPRSLCSAKSPYGLSRTA